MAWKIDIHLVDNIVDSIAKLVYITGDKSRVMQNANLSKSLLTMVIGLAFFVVLGAIYGFAK